MGDSQTAPLEKSPSLWARYWYGEASLVRLGVFRIVVLAAAYFAVSGYHSRVIQHVGAFANHPGRNWRALYAFELLGIGPPTPEVTRLVYTVLIWALILGVLGIATRVSCAVAALLSLYWIGTAYSFGKPHHDCVALAFALAALPLSPCGGRLSIDSAVRRWWRARRGSDPLDVKSTAAWAALPLRLTQITVAVGYFFAGSTKLFRSGWEWANGYTLQGIMIEHASQWTDFMSRNVMLCAFMSAGLLVVQASFPLVFIAPLTRWFYLPMAVTFHLVAMRTMSTGTFIPLWFLLVAFLPLERVLDLLASGLARGGWLRRLAVAVALGASIWIVGPMYFKYRPTWLPYTLVPVALALLLRLLPSLRVAYSFDPALAGSRGFAALVFTLDWGDRVDLAPQPREAPLLERVSLLALAVRLPLGIPALPLLALARLGAKASHPASAGTP